MITTGKQTAMLDYISSKDNYQNIVSDYKLNNIRMSTFYATIIA